MFEFSVARKYLTPRWRQLSVSIISMISMLVIALVVWLIVVFFSVTNGLEKRWVHKLTAVTAPVRVTPTSDYYNSYYYLVDSIAANSGYSLKTIGEKRRADISDPYDPGSDEELPFFWIPAERTEDGTLIDLVGEAFSSIQDAGDLYASDYELTGATIKLRLLRLQEPLPSQATLNQQTYVGALDPQSPQLIETLITHQTEDLENFYHMLGVVDQGVTDESNPTYGWVDPDLLHNRLNRFFESVTITELITPEHGWRIPAPFFMGEGSWRAILVDGTLPTRRLLVTPDAAAIPEVIRHLQEQGITAEEFLLEGNSVDVTVPIHIPAGIPLTATPIQESIITTSRPDEVLFRIQLQLQGKTVAGTSELGKLRFHKISQTKVNPSPPMWLHRDGNNALVLQSDLLQGDGILLPKAFREVGVRMGDRGFISFYTPTASTVQEQRLPVYVTGFYDPGIVPSGGKLVLTNAEVTSMIRASHETENNATTNGINVHFDDIAQADTVKQRIQENLKARGIENYWNVQTYREYEFTKPLLDQLQSDKTLFLLIATVIIIVACSNIISMLIIMVNDKKMEIGILRAMGASATSIATIFGLCGVLMGMIGSFIGISLAVVTLHNIDVIASLLSAIQGHTAFNPLYFGDSLPNEISFEALIFVTLVTGLLSLLAGIVPAVKASLLKPSAILRAE